MAVGERGELGNAQWCYHPHLATRAGLNAESDQNCHHTQAGRRVGALSVPQPTFCTPLQLALAAVGFIRNCMTKAGQVPIKNLYRSLTFAAPVIRKPKNYCTFMTNSLCCLAQLHCQVEDCRNDNESIHSKHLTQNQNRTERNTKYKTNKDTNKDTEQN